VVIPTLLSDEAEADEEEEGEEEGEEGEEEGEMRGCRVPGSMSTTAFRSGMTLRAAVGMTGRRRAGLMRRERRR